MGSKITEKDIFQIEDKLYTDILSKRRRVYRLVCQYCGKHYIRTKQSTTCGDHCRSFLARSKNDELISLGHYTKSVPEAAVTLLTKSLKPYTVSSCDMESVARIGWTTDKYGYLVANIKGTMKDVNIKLHRFILRAKDGEIVDHIDGDVTNNTRGNLRIVDKRINSLNFVAKAKTNTGEHRIFKRGKAFVVRGYRGDTSQKTFYTLADAIAFRDQSKAEKIAREIERLSRN